MNLYSVLFSLSPSLSFSVFFFCLHPCLEFSIITRFHSSLLSSNSRFSLSSSLYSPKPSLSSSRSQTAFCSSLSSSLTAIAIRRYIEYNNYSSLLCLLSASSRVLFVLFLRSNFVQHSFFFPFVYSAH